MADCAAIPSCTRVPLQMHSKMNLSVPRNVNARMLKRGYSFCRKIYCRPVSLKVNEVSAPLCIALKGSHCMKGSSLRCSCLGAFINIENVVPLTWASSFDEVLLVISIAFAYMGGAIPNTRTIPVARKDNTNQYTGASTSIPYGRSSETERESESKNSWVEVKEKLLEALNALELAANLKSGAVDSEVKSKGHPLSMLALADGPRLRLLWATLQQLQKEICEIEQNYVAVNQDMWLVVASKVLRGLVQPACIKWLEDELTLGTGDPSTKLITRISEKLRGDDTVSQNVDRSGKKELYADFLFHLRFGSLRTGCSYDSRLFILHGVSILEDLVIMLADGIASIYLELISVDSNMSSEINTSGLTFCTLSTRALQRLRNEVALNQWLQQNFESIVSMYEDRFEFSILCSKKLEVPLDGQSKKSVWWEIFPLWRSTTLPSLSYLQINQISLPAKRTKELRALTGWRYYFSLFLELSDITMPFIKTIFTKVSNAVSFFLVYMIGRSLGLIFSGIRQSLGWR